MVSPPVSLRICPRLKMLSDPLRCLRKQYEAKMVTYLVVGAVGLTFLMLVSDSQTGRQGIALKGGAAMLLASGFYGVANAALAT